MIFDFPNLGIGTLFPAMLLGGFVVASLVRSIASVISAYYNGKAELTRAQNETGVNVKNRLNQVLNEKQIEGLASKDMKKQK